MKRHRNSQKRIYFEDAVYFVTSVTKNRYPYFKEMIFADIFVENLRICRRMKQFRLYGWFLGHDHFHALIQPGDGFNISEIMRSIKTNTSCDINRIINPSEGAVPAPRLHEIYRNKFNIEEYQKQYIHISREKWTRFQWQKSYHDHIIRDDFDFENHFDYIQFNPEKHDLPEDWPYVSENPKYADLID